jgi:hypothetical protein
MSISEISAYTFNEHKHNYAVWTAARAVQRNFTKTSIIKAAIEDSGLKNFAEDNKNYSEEEFETFHKNCANRIINFLRQKEIKNVSYGRAAKIISIYLKTSVIFCNNGECLKSKIIHPPIYSILLKNIGINNEELKDLRNEKWTNLNEGRYWKLVSRLKSHFKTFDWRLEVYWK